MSALLSKALIVARGHARRLLRRPAARTAQAQTSGDVIRFERPALPESLASATREQLIEQYWRRHPRFIFFKGVAPNARVLDLGTGTGGLALWCEFLEPLRTDIQLYGVDLVAPATRALYADFAVANLDESFPFPEIAFDAVFASHMLEHIKEPAQLLETIATRLRVGGRAYIEMPSPESKSLPSAQEYRERGWPMMISNFHDDGTHRDTLALPDLIATGERVGLRCLESGAITSPYLEDALVARGIEWGDPEMLLYGYWSKTRWANYAVLERVIVSAVETPAAPYAPPALETIAPQLRNGRSVRDGYARGWGLEYGDLSAHVAADPLYREAVEMAAGRSVLDEERRKNLFLLMKFYLPKLPRGNIIEFGSYRGGNAIFMAHVARALVPGTQVYALDTFRGMPPTDKAIDAHSPGDFGDVDLEALRAYLESIHLDNVHLVPGRFEDTAEAVIAQARPFSLVHIDCDIYSAVAYSYEAIKHAMVPGGYLVFDDATISSCIGATEVVESLVIRRDGLSSEQIYPHFVFRSP